MLGTLWVVYTIWILCTVLMICCCGCACCVTPKHIQEKIEKEELARETVERKLKPRRARLDAQKRIRELLRG